MTPSPRKRNEDISNKRLDLFLQQLEIQEEKRKQIVAYVEELTQKTILEQNKEPKLRLNRP